MDKENMVYLYAYIMEYYLDIKKKGIMLFAGKCRNGDYPVCEISQAPEAKHCMFLLNCRT
jgi:hypothetical protein